MTRKVLSIQSHVVHGYVGNKAATFPLQYRGWDVDALNTVQFSNHPGYGQFHGFRSKAEDLKSIVKNGLVEGLGLQYDALLTGYLPDPEALRQMGSLLSEMCESNPNIKWILDPVLGDNGKLYVSQESIPAYKEILKRGAVFLATPNQFEIETLTGVQISDLNTLKTAVCRFHELYPKIEYVVVTSVDPEPSISDFMLCVCSDRSSKSAQYFKIPKIDVQFSGSGDLFSALLLDTFLSQSAETRDLARAVNEVVSLVDTILLKTLQIHTVQNAQDKSKRINDLKIIECRDLLGVKVDVKYSAFEL
ncbi:LADA_0F14312g1_1 [Lachancea dasiensis]|uniref:pyridoxal kinase n=1 Tax=Lachancea dasiensis TaxID=1072105 RepID=A0A1G4JNM5_9SACH|nr:LADA_0F14312g1_1 [Lachancea dasiensis]